jgi:hypothetical protein
MNMLIYRGGQPVKKGTFWNVRNGSRIDVGRKQELPGSGKDRYLRLSPPLMLLAGPILGLLYVVFLPVASIAIVALLIIKKILGGLVGLVSKLSYFEWRPAESYLAGKKKSKQGKGEVKGPKK